MLGFTEIKITGKGLEIEAKKKGMMALVKKESPFFSQDIYYLTIKN
jgi:hypothetical protein